MVSILSSPGSTETNFMSAERFELSTNGLKGRCSAVELRARRKKADCILTWEIFIVNVRALLSQKRQEKN